MLPTAHSVYNAIGFRNIQTRALLTRHTFALFAAFVFIAALFSCSKHEPQRMTAIHTIAGSNGEFGEPFGIAVKGDEIFVSDGANGKIYKMSGGGAINEYASGFDTPSAIVFAPNGDLIVADTGSHTIKSINAHGDVRVIAGIEGRSGSADGDAANSLFNGPIGVAVTGDGRIFVSDTYNDRIRVIENDKVSTIAGEFNTPLGLAIWDDKLLVADAGNRKIRVIEANGSIWTLAGNGVQASDDGDLLNASFVRPSAIAVNRDGHIFIADDNSIRVIGRRAFPVVETITDRRQGFRDGQLRLARFSRPSCIAFDKDGNLLVADSDNRVVRRTSPRVVETKGTPAPPTAEGFRRLSLARWPYDPPDAKRDVAGTLGEIRGEYEKDDSFVRFHNGLDIAGAFGETTRFIRDEKVLDPMAAENFSTLRELIRLPTIGYIHINLGRTANGQTFGDPRFLFSYAPDGKMNGVRVPRGTKLKAGEPVGTLNAMNHVHMIAGPVGQEMNALDALVLPNVSDSIKPTIESVEFFDENWRPIETGATDSRINLSGKTRITVRAHDRMDGNPERRKLGLYKLGYQVIKQNGKPANEVNWSIFFDRNPPFEAVKFVYAKGSQSGPTGETIFSYIVTNRLNKDGFGESFFDASQFDAGQYIIRVFVGDYFGNTTSKDITVEVIK